MLVEIDVLVDTKDNNDESEEEDVELEIVGADNEEELEEEKNEVEEVYETMSINLDYIAGIREKFGQGFIMMESMYFPKFILAKKSRKEVTNNINDQIK